MPLEPPAARTNTVVTRYRWTICSLLFAATTINYIDRQILSLIKPILDQQLGWTNEEFGLVNSAFQGAYAVGLLFFGWFVDRFGEKIGYSVSIIAWSISAIGHSFVSSVTGFFAARTALGLGESGNFPSAIKAAATWFPQRERAFATTLLNAGTNVGPIVAPAIVPWIALNYGWQASFIAAGVAGLLWLLLWIPFYTQPEKNKHVSPGELALILSVFTMRIAAGIGFLQMKRWGHQWMIITCWMGVVIWIGYVFNMTMFADVRYAGVVFPVIGWWLYDIFYITPFLAIPYLHTVNREIFSD